jgi:hypothetical protein
VKRETRVSCGAAALPGTRRVSARQGWAGEKSGLFEHAAGERITHGSEKSGELEPEAGRQDSAEPECLTPFFGNSLADSLKFRFE